VVSDGCIKRREALTDAYGAYFRPLTENDGLRHWFRWIDNPCVDLDAVIEAIEELGHIADRRPPKLGEVRATYERIKSEHRDTRTVSTNCDQCDNTGERWIVVGYNGGRKYIASSDKSFERVDIEKTSCNCHYGSRRNNTSGLVAAATSKIGTDGFQEAYDKALAIMDLNRRKFEDSYKTLSDAKRFASQF